jgi:hypothetical protein
VASSAAAAARWVGSWLFWGLSWVPLLGRLFSSSSSSSSSSYSYSYSYSYSSISPPSSSSSSSSVFLWRSFGRLLTLAAVEATLLQRHAARKEANRKVVPWTVERERLEKQRSDGGRGPLIVCSCELLATFCRCAAAAAGALWRWLFGGGGADDGLLAPTGEEILAAAGTCSGGEDPSGECSATATTSRKEAAAAAAAASAAAAAANSYLNVIKCLEYLVIFVVAVVALLGVSKAFASLQASAAASNAEVEKEVDRKDREGTQAAAEAEAEAAADARFPTAGEYFAAMADAEAIGSEFLEAFAKAEAEEEEEAAAKRKKKKKNKKKRPPSPAVGQQQEPPERPAMPVRRPVTATTNELVDNNLFVDYGSGEEID